MDKNWPRWIAASVNKHFAALLGSDLYLYIEGEPRRTNTQKDYAELRFDGPYTHERSRNDWLLDLEINVLVCSVPDEHDAHRIYKNSGLVASAFTRTIEVKRYGDGSGDDGSLLGCLVIKQDRQQTIFITNLGKIDPKVDLLQSTVEAHYQMELNT